MQPIYQVITAGADPAETLQIVATVPTTQVTFRGSLKELDARILDKQNALINMQAEIAADQALRDSIIGVFTAAGVKDVTAPITPTLVAAITDQNDAATKTLLQTQADDITAKLDTIAVSAQPAKFGP